MVTKFAQVYALLTSNIMISKTVEPMRIVLLTIDPNLALNFIWMNKNLVERQNKKIKHANTKLTTTTTHNSRRPKTT